jgi:hypothetical protein
MKRRITVLGALLLVMAIANVTPASAASTMGFTQGVSQWVSANASQWTTIGDVTIDAPGPGFVVVTASGMASFNTNAILELTLSTNPAEQGDWVFWLTAAPPMPTFQSFTVRMVFEVSGAGLQTFYLNGEGCNRRRGKMHVETGSITAEFYDTADVQQGPTVNSRQQVLSPKAQSAR